MRRRSLPEETVEKTARWLSWRGIRAAVDFLCAAVFAAYGGVLVLMAATLPLSPRHGRGDLVGMAIFGAVLLVAGIAALIDWWRGLRKTFSKRGGVGP